MKRILLLFLTISLIMNISSTSALALNQKPDYEKYGRIAIAIVKEDYPGEAVIEYQYTGRQKISDTAVVDSFTFQVKENNKPITVTVKIAHSLKNKKLLRLSVEEKKG
ncbi:YqzG/YhdC family protein [Bacillus sp. FJAT-29790]|uniref:DUF3889 domain-containing protein n=1 Tax=Bacillus sp. FJAT-29790 TaxID=1895002 RepID=UPI001C219002|nr:DUF3889 domain-containing protein [Bacillus sp. FJAT-29790]MBU8880109.1 YqzG/YhdC family protein [Bacillus sp. FJAT-29790]